MLRSRRLRNAKFRRQRPIGPYVVDFACLNSRLVIEVDGGQHADDPPERTVFLEKQGFRILRFCNNEVLTNIDGVLTVIADDLRNR